MGFIYTIHEFNFRMVKVSLPNICYKNLFSLREKAVKQLITITFERLNFKRKKQKGLFCDKLEWAI